MKKLLILSGKGGTGKTTISSAFIKLANARAYADCDVDAPNLHLVMSQNSIPKQSNYYGLPKAEIDLSICVKCGLCIEKCRFEAINSSFEIEKFACEGCGVCETLCPVEAISLKPVVSGDLMLYSEDNVFSTAQLRMGYGTSGLLVTEVKRQMIDNAHNVSLAIIDGSPGIGCPVIASISGVDMVLIVAEPSISGISDMERIIKTANKFHTRIVVTVNKFDTNISYTEKIEQYCIEHNIPFVGKIPFDIEAVKTINNGYTLIDVECKSGNAIKEVYKKTMYYLNIDKIEGSIDDER